MRKQDHDLPPDLKRDIRLLNSVIDRRKYKRPNAQKYGIFATPVIIPGEDRDEYFELLAELLVEWNASGPSLRHAVYCLADSMWRLRRLKKAVQTELCTDTFDPKHPAFQEQWGFIMFHSYLRSHPETCFEKHAKNIFVPPKSAIWNKSSRVLITSPHQNGPRPSRLKLFPCHTSRLHQRDRSTL